MSSSLRRLALAATAALPLLAAACTDKPKATDPDKTATVVPETTMSASDSAATAAKTDSLPK